MAEAKDIGAIEGYHAHIYYDPEHTKEAAAWVREQIEQRFTPIRMGRWHDVPVGPHPTAMFQVAFGTELFRLARAVADVEPARVDRAGAS